MLNGLIRFFTPCFSVHDAARKGEIKRINDLYKVGVNIDSGYGQTTPLYLAFVSRKYEAAILLLKLGASPNAWSYDSSTNKIERILQLYLDLSLFEDHPEFPAKKSRNISLIRLLALYGASSHDLIFPKRSATAEFKAVYDTGHVIYEEIAVYKAILAANSLHQPPEKEQLQEMKAACEQLSAIWQKLADEESLEPCKTHYTANAKEYRDMAEDFAFKLSGIRESKVATRPDEVKTPLLKGAATTTTTTTTSSSPSHKLKMA